MDWVIYWGGVMFTKKGQLQSIWKISDGSKHVIKDSFCALAI